MFFFIKQGNKVFTLEIAKFADASLILTFSMWYSHVHLFRYSVVKRSRYSCVLLLNRIYFVFETFSVSLFALNQSEAFINSWFAILYNSLKSLEEIWNVKSMVKSLSDILSRSLIRIKNRIGPSTEPWYTCEYSTFGWTNPIYYSVLCTISEIVLKPFIWYSSKAVVCKFSQENIDITCIKSIF